MLSLGIKGSEEIIVTRELLASSIGSGLVQVFGTPMMIAGLEGCAARSVAACLENGQTTVGTHLNVSHEAATPLGMRVRFETELIALSPNGRLLTFRVTARDECGIIGQGTHERAVVWTDRFEQKTNAKMQNIPQE